MKQGKETGESHLVDVMIDCMKQLSGKFKIVSLNEITEFPFWGIYICVDLHQEVENKERT